MFATSAAVKHIARREATAKAVANIRAMSNLAAYDDFGSNVFTGKVAAEYLAKHGASADTLKDPNWVNSEADAVANAVFDW
jgi:hypothetical protein